VVQLVRAREVHAGESVSAATEDLAPTRLQRALLRAGLLLEKRYLHRRDVLLVVEQVSARKVNAREGVRAAAEDLPPLLLHGLLPEGAALQKHL